jgi:hypothetical protein
MSPKENYEPPLRIQIIIRNIFLVMAYILVLTLFLALFWYPERYYAFQEHISNLGGFLSYTSSLPNTASMFIMIIGFGVCGALALTVSILYFVNKELRGRIPKGILALVLAFGAGGIAVPLDHPTLRILHLIGAACFIGGFATFNAYLQITSTFRKHVKGWNGVGKGDAIWDFILSLIVIGILVVYFVFYAWDQLVGGIAPLGPLLQKITVFSMVLAFYFIDNTDI